MGFFNHLQTQINLVNSAHPNIYILYIPVNQFNSFVLNCKEYLVIVKMIRFSSDMYRFLR